jgi:hypothetical protein
MDTEDTGFATGLSMCLLKDGTQTVTANIPFAGFKLTGVGTGTAATDVANISQLQNATTNWVVAAGTADVITASYSPAVTTLVDGMELDFRATAANATTTPTFSPNGLAAYTITQLGGDALVVGNISGALFEARLRYNLANTRWELMNPAVITPAPFLDTNPLIKGSVDATKLARFEVDGLTTATTRAYTLPDYNGTLATLAGTETLSGKTLDTATIAATQTTGDNSTKIATTAFVATAITPAYLWVREEQTSGTAPQTLSAAWTKRTLNVSKSNSIAGASLTSSVISLPAGTYEINATSPSNPSLGADGKCRLENTSDGTTIALGTNVYGSYASGGNGIIQSIIVGTFSLAATKNLELQHYSALSSVGGRAVSIASISEVYANVLIKKVG